MLNEFGISKKLIEYSKEIEMELREYFIKLDEIAEYNQYKVIKGFQDCQISDFHFMASSGYGYNDAGRDCLEKVYASIFHTDDALVRPQIVSGTHALSIAMFGNLRPGDEVVSISGKPYDTLEQVIGIVPSKGSLAEYGVSYQQVDLKDQKMFDYKKIEETVTKNTKMVIVQRSKGYQTRKSLCVKDIGEAITFVKNINSNVIVMVDNCYGEFVETIEPSDVGADLIVGSLIKNPGGGLAPTGGYIAGTMECIEQAAVRLTSPGLGKEVGASLGVLNSFYQGLFLAPVVSINALKGSVFAAKIYDKLGFETIPSWDEKRTDIIQSIILGKPQSVIEFCKGIQSASPVDAHVSPEPWSMPGYDCEVIMAAGTFVQGSSIELSADAPMKPPYAVYFQGGLTWFHSKLGILKSLQNLIDKKIIEI